MWQTITYHKAKSHIHFSLPDFIFLSNVLCFVIVCTFLKIFLFVFTSYNFKFTVLEDT